MSDLGRRPYFAANTGYVESPVDTLIASTDALKRTIYAYGPLVSAVAATPAWDRYERANPDWEKEFPRAIFNGTPTSQLSSAETRSACGWSRTRGARIGGMEAT